MTLKACLSVLAEPFGAQERLRLNMNEDPSAGRPMELGPAPVGHGSCGCGCPGPGSGTDPDQSFTSRPVSRRSPGSVGMAKVLWRRMIFEKQDSLDNQNMGRLVS